MVGVFACTMRATRRKGKYDSDVSFRYVHVLSRSEHWSIAVTGSCGNSEDFRYEGQTDWTFLATGINVDASVNIAEHVTERGSRRLASQTKAQICFTWSGWLCESSPSRIQGRATCTSSWVRDKCHFSQYAYCNKLNIIKLNTRPLSRFKSSTNNTRSYWSGSTLARDKAEKTHLFSFSPMKRKPVLLH